ncbi:hypothetical protein [Pseudomonas sp. RIT-PI-S]|uniref:hypothetical protein n=1 Tax=Pseudomonas sp. RIT-PI-S TaxID=3035295 RepID=UPI0021D953CA|nr:hypothetical protein [Pseudomonas sp. RIT-PI-S]
MTTATPSKNVQSEYPCVKCDTMFQRRPGGRQTCSPACAKAVERQKKAPKLTAKQRMVERRKERQNESAFGGWLIDQAIRAGTVQTFRGVDAQVLHLLDAQYTYTKKRFGWVNKGHGKDEFSLCHVQPLVGRDGSIGLTTPENLFTGVATLNQKQSDKPVSQWAGASVPVSDRKRKWNITDNMTRGEVLQKIADFLGKEFDAYLVELDRIPQRTARLRLARSVFKHQGEDRYEPLERRYTLAELQSLKLEQLESLDMIQRGRTSKKDFLLPNCPPDSLLGVLHDELARFSDVLPDGKHKENCRFMLSVVRVLGLYLAQIRNSQGTARNRFSFSNVTWSPLQYLHHERPWNTPASVRDPDLESLLHGEFDRKGKALKPGVIPSAQDALQGNDIDHGYVRNRLLKRLTSLNMIPSVLAPDQYSWKACGSNWLAYIDSLYASVEKSWQAMLDLHMCTEEQLFVARADLLFNLEAAVQKARQLYKTQIYYRLGAPFKRYPSYLEFPPVAYEPAITLAA